MPRGLLKEFSRTANSWLSCFGSSVFVIEIYISSLKGKELLPQEKYVQAEQRIEELKAELYDFKGQYPNKRTIPPENIKQELLRKLDIFREID